MRMGVGVVWGRTVNVRDNSGVGGFLKGNIREVLGGSSTQRYRGRHDLTDLCLLPSAFTNQPSLSLSLLIWEMGVQILPWHTINAR